MDSAPMGFVHGVSLTTLLANTWEIVKFMDKIFEEDTKSLGREDEKGI
jgi:hypothetical protein